MHTIISKSATLSEMDRGCNQGHEQPRLLKIVKEERIRLQQREPVLGSEAGQASYPLEETQAFTECVKDSFAQVLNTGLSSVWTKQSFKHKVLESASKPMCVSNTDQVSLY